MQRSLDARPVVPSKLAHSLLGTLQVFPVDGTLAEHLDGRSCLGERSLEPRLRLTSEVKHHLEQVRTLGVREQLVSHICGEHLQERVEVVVHAHRAVEFLDARSVRGVALP